MGCHVEWIRDDVGILRVGRDFQKYYDPFEFSCVVDRCGDTVMFKGAVGNVGHQLVKERTLIRAFLPIGIRYVTWERVINGTQRMFTIDLSHRSDYES